jgi:hypothetical protein
MISSVGGKYEDMVCFAPTVTLDWSTLLQHFNKVFQALHLMTEQILEISG